MSRNKRPRKAYRPRPVTADTMALALHHAAKPAQQDRAEVLGILRAAIGSLCAGTGSEQDWSITAGSVSVAQAIEQQGIVRGLAGHLAAAELALQAIYDRCARAQGRIWLRPTLTLAEIDALRLLLQLHSYQVHQLGRAELLAAMATAKQATVAAGHTATLADDLAPLREAA